MSTKILIVDDDQYTRQVLGKILMRDRATARFKPQVIQAANGAEGVEAFLEHRPRLAIIDLFMPKMDGFAVCKKLREEASAEELTIAVTSGVYKDANIAAKVEEKFEAHFFAKPYQLKHIAEFVAGALGNTGKRMPTARTANVYRPPSGELSAENNAARLFWELMEEEATGRLVLRRGQVVRQLELFVGHPVKVTTNVREETLGNFLVLRGKIDKGTHRSAMAIAASTQKRLGETFLAMGVLSPEELISELTAQARFKLANALRWEEGTWTFRPGEPRNSRSNALDFAEVIVTELARTTRVQSPDREIADLARRPLVLNTRGRALLDQLATSVSSQFAESFRDQMTMTELRQAGVSRAHLFRCLDVLRRCGGVEAGPAPAIPRELSVAKSEAIDLREIATTRPKSSTTTSLYAGLFDSDVPPGTQTGASPLASLAEDVSDSALIESITFDGGDTIEDIEPDAKTRAGTDKSFEEESTDGDFDEDSVVSVSFATIGPDEDQIERRHDLLQEFLRIHETSLYEVLSLSTAASAREVEAAYDRQAKRFSKSVFKAEELGRDYAKLNIVLATYQEARDTLLSPEARKAYDESLRAAQQDLPNAPSMNAGIAFQEGEDFLAEGKLAEAIAKFERAIQISPHEPDYHATLGWALFLHRGQDEHAADAARSHMNEALAIAPDSGLVHEYKGLVHAKLGDDPEAALQHLAKALDDDPRRGNALAAIESLHLARGEHRQLDKLYRRLLFHIGQHAGAEGAVLWRRMGDLHRHYLQEPEQALVAYREAFKRKPDDAELKALCSELATGGRSAFYEATDARVATWREVPADYAPVSELYQVAVHNDQFDTAFLASSVLTLSGQANEDQESFYRRYRPRFLVRAQATVGREQWQQLLHAEDDPLVGDLFGLLHEAIAELHPQKRAEEEVAQADVLSSGELSEHFRRTRQYLSNVLGVPEPTIYSRSDFGREIHVASLRTPVLLAGYEAVTCTDKLEVAFRLARAMSYLRPGRAIAAGCPSRVLKSAMMACYSLGAPHANVPDPDGSIAEFREVISRLPSDTQAHALDLVGRLSRERPSLNLSRWTQVIPRTADRVGLLLSGDLGASMHGLGQPLGSPAAVELMSFAMSSAHAQLRTDMGLSIDV